MLKSISEETYHIKSLVLLKQKEILELRGLCLKACKELTDAEIPSICVDLICEKMKERDKGLIRHIQWAGLWKWRGPGACISFPIV